MTRGDHDPRKVGATRLFSYFYVCTTPPSNSIDANPIDTMASDMNSHSSDKKGSSRFSRLLGGKREKSLERSERSDRPQASTMPTESGYASSDTPSARPNTMHDNSTSDIVPAERDSEIADIDKGRNLGLRPTTGEVFDRDTGEMVTVVTTTTTTVSQDFHISLGANNSRPQPPVASQANTMLDPKLAKTCRETYSSRRLVSLSSPQLSK